MSKLSLLLASGAAFLGYFRIEENFAPPLPLFYVFWGLKILQLPVQPVSHLPGHAGRVLQDGCASCCSRSCL